MKFPVIALREKDDIIYYLEKNKDLFVTTEKLFEKKFFLQSILIDSNGYIYKPYDAKKICYAGIFGFNPLLKSWWNDREIKIELKFEDNINKIDFENLKHITIEKIQKSKWFWEAAWDIGDLKKAINEAKTFEELILLFK